LVVERIVLELEKGRPVILHGFGGPLGEHFLLAVGFTMAEPGRGKLVAIDPYPGRDVNVPAQKIEFDLAEPRLQHPVFSDIKFGKMRLIESDQAVNRGAPQTSKDVLAVKLKDGTAVVGSIRNDSLTFRTTYGDVKVRAAEVSRFQGSILTLKDMSSLKGSFIGPDLSIASDHGVLNLPVGEIIDIAKPSAAGSLPGALSPCETAKSLMGLYIRRTPDPRRS